MSQRALDIFGTTNSQKRWNVNNRAKNIYNIIIYI